MQTIALIVSYFNPFDPGSNRRALDEYRELDTVYKTITVFLTALAFIATIPVFGCGAVAAFRMCTKKFSKIDLQTADNKTIKKTAQTFTESIRNKPMGFKNWGNSCWVNSGMQSLLACQNFERLVRETTLEKGQVPEKVFNGTNWQWSFRAETDEEFATRQAIQSKLIQLLNEQNVGNIENVHKALQELHSIFLKIKSTDSNQSYLSPIGKPDSCMRALFLCNYALGGSIRDLMNDVAAQRVLDAIKNVPDYHEALDKELLIGEKEFPKIVYTRLRSASLSNSEDVNTNSTFSISKDGIIYSYRIVAVVQHLSSIFSAEHFIAFVRKGDSWFCCNDNNIEQKMPIKPVDAEMVVFEQIPSESRLSGANSNSV